VSCCVFSFIAADISRDSVSSALLDCRFLLWVVGGGGIPFGKPWERGIPIGKTCFGAVMEFTEDAVKLSSSCGIGRAEFCFAVLKASVELFVGLKFPRISVPFVSSLSINCPHAF
jgi:hypothetical protein